jgi:hypothetical protein
LPVPTQQFRCPPKHSKRIAAQPDVAVGQQDGLPPTCSRQWFEHISTKYRRAVALRQANRRRGLVDPQRGDAASNEFGHQSTWATTQIDRRTLAQLHDSAVKGSVSMTAAEPPSHRQTADLSVVMTHPTPLTV